MQSKIYSFITYFFVAISAIIAQPKITSFSPLSGDIGTTVTINGINFNTTPASNLVRFGVAQAKVLTASANQLTVNVPAGANYEAISIMNTATGLGGNSSSFFLPSFSPSKGRIHDTDFGGGAGLSLTNAQVFASTVSDLNNDGLPDLLALGGYSTASSNRLYFGTNSSTLGIPSFDKDSFTLGTPSMPLNMATGDIDGDGKNDVLFTLFGLSGVSILRNITSGIGGFIWFAPRITATTNGSPYGVALIDVDGDGKKDIVTTSKSGGFISVLPNISTVGAISFGTAKTFATGTSPEKVESADIDGDGKWDLVVTNRTATSISVLLNTSTGAGNFNFANKIDYTTGKGVKNVSIGDIDGDGKLDIVSSNDSASTLSIFRNLSTVGNINFAAKYDYSIGSNLDYTGISDFDGDGKLDIAVNSSYYKPGTTYTSYLVSIAKNNSSPGNFSFIPPVRFNIGTSISYLAYTGDVTLDGKPDFMAYGTGFVTVGINNSAPSSNADLSALNILGANLSPAFTTLYPKPTSFSVNIPYDSATIHVLAAVVDTGFATLSVHVNGKGYNALTASVPGAVILDTGSNLIEVKVTAQNGAVKIYTIKAIRLLPPQLTWVNTTSGTIGTLLQLKGKGLLVNPSITIGGVSAVVVSNTDTTLTALVMPNTPSGQIKVTTGSGSAIYPDVFIVTTTTYPSALEGSRQTVAGGSGTTLGFSLALSADGNTAVYGCPGASSNIGRAGVSIRTGSSWSNVTFYGASDNVGKASQGRSIAVSADGNTFIVGGPGDNNNLGAAWIFKKKNGVYQQLGTKVIGTGYSLSSYVKMGTSVAISSDGKTAAIGGPGNSFDDGKVWVFTINDSAWIEQASFSVVDFTANLGSSLAFSADGNTLLIGASGVNTNIGSSYVFVRNGTTWTQQGKLTGTGTIGFTAYQGAAVALSADGNTALIGGYFDSSGRGACWAFKRTGTTWKQDGKKIVNNYLGNNAQFGYSVSLNADGTIAAIGSLDNSFLNGQPFIYKRENGVWVRKVNNLASTGIVSFSNTYFGAAVAISADGNYAMTSASGDDSYTGSVWHYVANISNVSSLSGLSTSVGSLTPTFNASVLNYNLNAGTANSISVTPTLTDTTATLLINIKSGALAQVKSGATSPLLSLNFGANVLKVTVVSQAGTYTTYSLNVNRDCSKDTINTVKSICAAALPYLWNGGSYTSSGTYYKFFKTSFGCDSVTKLQLSVVNLTPTRTATNLSACNSLFYNGSTYYDNTLLNDTIKTKDGCDSVYNTVTISILKFATTTLLKSFSACNSLYYNGKNFTNSTIYTDTLKSVVNGCDSVYNIYNITINKIQASTSITYISGCGSVTHQSTIYSTSTVLNDTVRTSSGCDSIYNITNIIVSPIPVSDTFAIACTGSINWYGTNYTRDTIVNHVLVNHVLGTINEGFSGNTTPTASTGWTFSGALDTYQTAGNFGAASPSVKFAATNDQITTPTLSGFATQLSFWLKNQGATGSSLKIEGFNGSIWITVNTLTTFPSSGTTIQYNATSTPQLPTGLKQFRFTYTKSAGNLALDDISIVYSGSSGCDSSIVLHLTVKTPQTITKKPIWLL